MVNLLLIAALISTPYVDAKKRFALDLPGGWEQGPMPADASGVSFRCTIGDKIALAAVKVVPAAGKNAAGVVRKLGESLESQPGYRLTEEGSTEIAGRPAARRRYVAYVEGNPEMVKTAEDRVVVAEGKGYVIHVESLSSSFYDFEDDFAHIYETFRLGAKPGKRAIAAAPVVGKWLMDGTPDTFLDLTGDGSFDLAGTRGTYKVQGKKLLMFMPGGMEEFSFVLKGDGLTLSNANLGEPIRYTRTSGPAHPLVGSWAGGGKSLELGTDGSATVDGKTGTYRIDGKKLVLQIGGKKRVVRFTIDGNELVLKGWKYKRTKLERQ